MNPRAFFVHPPLLFSRERGCMVALDISSAAEHGEVVTIFPGPHIPVADAQGVARMREAMADFGPLDYLAIAGQFDLVVWAAGLAFRRVGGKLKLLRWDNRLRRYDVKVCPEGLFDQ